MCHEKHTLILGTCKLSVDRQDGPPTNKHSVAQASLRGNLLRYEMSFYQIPTMASGAVRCSMGGGALPTRSPPLALPLRPRLAHRAAARAVGLGPRVPVACASSSGEPREIGCPDLYNMVQAVSEQSQAQQQVGRSRVGGDLWQRRRPALHQLIPPLYEHQAAVVQSPNYSASSHATTSTLPCSPEGRSRSRRAPPPRPALQRRRPSSRRSSSSRRRPRPSSRTRGATMPGW